MATPKESDDSVPANADNPPPLDWREFLEEHPPDKRRVVIEAGRPMTNGGQYYIVETPELQLHCDTCDGVRTFVRTATSDNQLRFGYWEWVYITYRCRNCDKESKVYSVGLYWEPAPSDPTGLTEDEENTQPQVAFKFGEWPPLGPVLPKRLLKFLGDDAELFKRGNRAEGQGMGIGAFAYYRRVVENQRTRLFDKLIEAAEKLKVDKAIIDDLRADRENWQFSQSVDGLKAALPDSLKIEGHSPMALLHNALSHNLHSESDETCLQAAQDIRHVLTEFARRLQDALKDKSELAKSIGRLTQAKTKPSS
jgi:hypothetical protein